MSNFTNPQEDTFALRIILASATSALPAIVFANDLSHGLYWDVNGLHLTGVADPVNTDDVANKNYVDTHGGGVSFPLRAPDGSPSAPSYSFATSPGMGFYVNTVNTWLGLTVNSSDVGYIVNGDNAGLGNGGIVLSSNQDYVMAGGSNGFHDVSGSAIAIEISNVTSGQFDGSSTAGDTRFLLWDVDSGALQRVTVGIANSGGSGFKVLRIPN